ncbi:MAG: rRNA maturation RNase YbeY [Oceanicaulis sp.]
MEFVIDDARWRDAGGLQARAGEAVCAALAHISDPRPGEIVVMLTGDETVHALNTRFRGKDKPTNVLSFPAPSSENYPGDVALAYESCAREAAAAGKSLEDHAVHLVLHGVLHLNGYDHQEEGEAAEMEALESAILTGLGMEDPYLAGTEP